MKRCHSLAITATMLVVAAAGFPLANRGCQPTPKAITSLAASPTPSSPASPAPSPAAPTPAVIEAGRPATAADRAVMARDLDGQRQYLAEFKKSVDLAGLVLEEQTQAPVAGAEVRLGALSNPSMGAAQPPDVILRTDAAGHFAFTGHRGASLVVNVAKEGYYKLAKRSGAVFNHDGAGAQIGWRKFPADDGRPNEPALFYLRKRGAPAALIHFDLDQRVPLDGAPYQISLSTGVQPPLGRGDYFQVECWGSNRDAPRGEPYGWHCRVSVPGGGLIARTDPFDFQAPEAGYQEADEIDMPKDLGRKKWQSHVTRSYFLQLPGGKYARARFEMISGGNHFFHLISYLNRTPGDRNLEAAPDDKPGGMEP